jgi:hypothetical protein
MVYAAVKIITRPRCDCGLRDSSALSHVSQAQRSTEWCAADPESSQTQSLERSRISDALFHAASHPGNKHWSNLPRSGNVSSIMRAVGARNTTF